MRRLSIIFSVILFITSLISFFLFKVDYIVINLFLSIVIIAISINSKSEFRIKMNLFSSLWFELINLIAIVSFFINKNNVFSFKSHMQLIYGVFIIVDLCITFVYENRASKRKVEK